MTLPRLLVLTDRSQLPLGRGLLATLRECRDAGLTHVVVRELDEAPERRAALCRAVADLGLVVIAAHRPLPGARGVHLPAGAAGPGHVADPPGARHAHPDGGDGLLGRSCHSRADVTDAAAEGCDYATLGPFATTRSKPGYGPPLPPSEYADHAIPVYALGGVSPANAGAALAAGAHGVAVMGAVMRAAQPAAVVRDLRRVVG